jgi:hypothetical protein
MFGMIGLLVMSVFGGGALMWLICPTPSMICLSHVADLRHVKVPYNLPWKSQIIG